MAYTLHTDEAARVTTKAQYTETDGIQIQSQKPRPTDHLARYQTYIWIQGASYTRKLRVKEMEEAKLILKELESGELESMREAATRQRPSHTCNRPPPIKPGLHMNPGQTQHTYISVKVYNMVTG